MGGYYPDGVTGNEPEISGAYTSYETVTCGSEESVVAPVHMLLEGIGGLTDLKKRLDRALANDKVLNRTTLHRLSMQLGTTLAIFGSQIEETKKEVEYECSYSEEVEGEMRSGVFCWTCPQCGAEQELDLTPSEMDRDDYEQERRKDEQWD